jgi:ribosomal protein S18 acetylase RimI-like enzyme
LLLRFEGSSEPLEAQDMTIDIVPVREDLIEGFHAALDAVCRERIYLAFLEAPPLEETRAFLRANMAKGTPQFLATSADRVVGWCDVNPLQRPTMRHSGVLGIGLVGEYRGRGLGEKLMLMTLEAAHAFGLTRVELSVRHDNTRALGLYRKVGFEIEGRKRRAVRVDDVYHDLIFMGLLLHARGKVPAARGQAL